MLKIVGAGVGRTGTNSLKVALEQLIGGRCYHMYELVRRDQDLPVWEEAVRGEAVDWDALMSEFTATVDWPAASFWKEIYAANPDAHVLLSTRGSTDEWWESVSKTISVALDTPVPPDDPTLKRRRAMTRAVLQTRFAPVWEDADASRAAYERHNAEVRAAVPAERLIEWQPGDGWTPICEALGMAEPADPFPHENTRAEFRANILSAPEPSEAD